jgi:hypothetical protein
MIDISPKSFGNSPLPEVGDWAAYYDLYNGGDWGTGYALNPVTGQPYVEQLVPRGDYARILAEFWADGPDSETPPGHWFSIANYVFDHPLFEKRMGGVGPVLDDLEWDVKLYLTLGGTMHDVAISAWGVKGWYDYIRPGWDKARTPMALHMTPADSTCIPATSRWSPPKAVLRDSGMSTSPTALERSRSMPGGGRISSTILTWMKPGWVGSWLKIGGPIRGPALSPRLLPATCRGTAPTAGRHRR